MSSTGPLRAIVYSRVSTEDQAIGLSLETQEKACLAEVGRRGWTVAELAHEKASGKGLRGRPVLRALLARLTAREADALVVSRLDRLTRSTGDFYALMDQAAKEGWVIVTLDPPVDMSHPFGRAMAGVAAIFAQLERDLISQRQKDSVRARKLAGTYKSRTTPDAVLDRAIHLRNEGWAWRPLCLQLRLEGHVPPAGGKQWDPSRLKRAIESRERDRALLEEG